MFVGGQRPGRWMALRWRDVAGRGLTFRRDASGGGGFPVAGENPTAAIPVGAVPAGVISVAGVESRREMIPVAEDGVPSREFVYIKMSGVVQIYSEESNFETFQIFVRCDCISLVLARHRRATQKRELLQLC